MSDLDDDQALVRRLLTGDEAAFEAFFARAFPALYRFALARVGGDAGAAEEVAQATLVAAMRRLAGWRGEAALLTWLCAICRHEIAARRARASRHAHQPLVEDDLEVRAALESLADAERQTPGSRLERLELARLVRAALDALPPRYAIALSLKYLDDRPVEDVAARLGVSAKAAESVLTRARDAFRDAFATLAGGRREAWRLGHG